MADNRQILEGLWGLGYSTDALKQMDTSGDLAAFKARLAEYGVNPLDVQTSIDMVDWRRPKSTAAESWLMDYFRSALHMPQTLIDQIVNDASKMGNFNENDYRSSDPNSPWMKALLEASRAPMGPQGFSNTLIKLGLASNINAYNDTTWNPMRGDASPAGVRTSAPQQPPGVTGADIGQASGGWRSTPVPGSSSGQPGSLAPAGPGGAGAPAGSNYMPKLTPKFVPRTDAEINAFIQANFGADVWWLDVPEVHDILWSMAKDGNTDGAEASRRVKGTQWYRNTEAQTRNWEGRKNTEPGSIASDIREQVAFLQQQVTGMGFSISPERLSAIAESSLRFGWSPAQIKTALGAEYHYAPDSKDQAAEVGLMKQFAAKYMVPMSDETIGIWAEGMVKGTFSEQQFQEYIKGSAKSLFPQLAAAIDAGHTVEDYADPYKQLAAKTLEIPPEKVNFMEGQWRSALEQIDPKTGQKTVMTLTDWEQQIKTDPKYGYDKTNQSMDEAAGLANMIAKKFGKVA